MQVTRAKGPSSSTARAAAPKARVRPEEAEAPIRVCPVPGLSQGSVPAFLRVRSRIQWWREHAQDPEVLHLILHGVGFDWVGPDLPVASQGKGHSPQEVAAAATILREYEEAGAVCRPPPPFAPRYVIPWFVISKPEGEGQKHRLISDCRVLNQFLQPKHFRLDHIGNVFPMLRKGMWGAKVDLKNAYFHLELHPNLKDYVCLDVGGVLYRFEASCFGLSTLPELFMKLMKVFLRKWRLQGFQVFVYLDDILLIASSRAQLQTHLQVVRTDLQDAGMVVNEKKSLLEPAQEIPFLGFMLDLRRGLLCVPAGKLKAVRKELGKFLTHPFLSCRKVAAILGATRALLPAVPFLRCFTDLMVAFTDQHRWAGWDKRLPVSEALVAQAKETKSLFVHWVGRPFQDDRPVRQLHADASNEGWAGIDSTGQGGIQEFWRDQKDKHKNWKELWASISTVLSFAKPGELVQIHVDNSVAYSYLKKLGGRKQPFNDMLRPLVRHLISQKILLEPLLVPSAEQKADALSRWSKDPGDYTLDTGIFTQIQKNFAPFINPWVDMFASPGNAKYPHFVCRWPHWQAWACNALEMDLSDVGDCYANPPGR